MDNVEYVELDGKKYRLVRETDDELHHVQSFLEKHKQGVDGKNKSIPTGFESLSKFFGIRKQVYMLVGGFTGFLQAQYKREELLEHPKALEIKIIQWAISSLA